MRYKIDYSKIPKHCREGVQRYIEEGCPTGGFLRALLENDLMESFRLADDINLKRMRDWISFLYYEAPMGCRGSSSKVNLWIEKGGLNGLRTKATSNGG